MARFDVVGVGTAACDYVIPLERFPGPDEKVRTDELLVEGGGTVGTALVAVARLGLKAAWAGVLGEDDFGRFILEGLDRERVDTSLVRTVAGARSPFAFCVAVAPARNVFSVRPTTPPLALGDAEMDAVLDTRALHLDGAEEEAALAAATAARKRGVEVSVDLQRLRPSTERLLALADVAVVSESFSRQRFPGLEPIQAVRSLYRAGMRVAAITLGALGVVATEGGAPYAISAEAVEVVDTTGAGDVFHGALLVGLLEGKSVRHSLELATHVAALSCRSLGGRAGIPRRDEVVDLL